MTLRYKQIEYDDENVMIDAALKGKDEDLGSLECGGFDILSLLIMRDRLEDAAEVLNRGFPIDSSNPGSGNTALNVAARHGKLEAARFLLNQGASIEGGPISDCTPLHEASMFGYIDIVKLLIEHGANVNAVTENDETPLDLAESNAIASLLETYGGKRSF